MQAVHYEVSQAPSLLPAAARLSGASPFKGVAVDLLGYDAAEAIVLAGVWTDGTHTPKLQESVDTTDGDFGDVAAGDMIGTFTAITSALTASNAQRVSYVGSKRYIRIVLTTAATTSGAYVDGGVLRLKAKYEPTT
jgi:hypothetical protein